MARIIVYRKYNEYITYDSTLSNILELKKMFDEEGFKWYIISYGTEQN